MRAPTFYLQTLPEIIRAWLIEPEVERGRLGEGPVPLLERLRRWGRAQPTRDPQGRLRLRAAIGIAERLRGRRPNCYRRVLMEVALDAGAAVEPVHLALDSNGGVGSGHAYLESHDQTDGDDYDARFAV